MVFILLVILFIAATWRWGDWRNWKVYQSTILFFLLSDMFYNYLTSLSQYPLWVYLPVSPIRHYVAASLLGEIIFMCTPLIYLGSYPEKNRGLAFLWIGFWVVIYAFIEWFLQLIGGIKYDNGWTLLYSTLFNLMMFPMLRLHYKHPLIAYVLSIPITIALLILTKVPIK